MLVNFTLGHCCILGCMQKGPNLSYFEPKIPSGHFMWIYRGIKETSFNPLQGFDYLEGFDYPLPIISQFKAFFPF